MTRIDFSCPIELLSFDRADFGSERAQGYLTFLNESAQEITCIKGKLIILEEGEILFEKDVTLSGLSCAPGEKMDAHLALDGAPEGDDARFEPYCVTFLEGDKWFFSEEALVECVYPPAAQGREKIALIAMAGADAVYFPQTFERTWLCTCGRFNRSRWGYCRRCARKREEALLLTREEVLQQYAAYEEEMKARGSFPPPAAEEKKPVRTRGAAVKAEETPKKKKNGKKRRNPLLQAACWLLVLALALGCLFAVYTAADSLLDRINAASAYPIEYLAPVR